MSLTILIQPPIGMRTPWGLLLSTDEFIKMAFDVGADGGDWWPYLRLLLELRLGKVSQETFEGIGSCHMSFRGETWGGMLKKVVQGKWKAAVRDLSLLVALPYYKHSFKHLVRLKEAAGRSIPSVIYPHRSWDGDDPYPVLDLSYRLVQPSQDHVTHLGVASLYGFSTNYPKNAGFLGYCLDLFHMLLVKTPKGGPLGTWEEIMTALAKHVHLYHLGAGRQDFWAQQLEAGIDSMEWLQSLYHNRRDSLIWQMLGWIKKNDPYTPIVLEIPTDAIYVLTKCEGLILNRYRYQLAMRQIIQNIKAFFDEEDK